MMKFLVLVSLFASCHGAPGSLQHKADKMCERRYGGTQIAHVNKVGDASCERVTEDMFEWCFLNGHKCVKVPENK